MGLKRIGYSIAIVIALLILSSVGLRTVLGFGSPVYVVSSGSMLPTLRIGDLIFVVDGGTFGDVNVGDIIVFKSPYNPSKVIVHRVVEIVEVSGPDGSDMGFITKGDNNPGRDGWIVKREDYLGRVFFVIPYAGSLSLALRPPVNYIIIALLLMIILLGELAPRRSGD